MQALLTAVHTNGPLCSLFTVNCNACTLCDCPVVQSWLCTSILRFRELLITKIVFQPLTPGKMAVYFML